MFNDIYMRNQTTKTIDKCINFELNNELKFVCLKIYAAFNLIAMLKY